MPPSLEMANRISELKSELEKAIGHYGLWARVDYWFAQILMIVTLAASTFAVILGLGLGASGKVTGIVGAIPGITALVAATLKPQGRASWHYRKKDELQGLRHRLLFQLPETPTADNIAAISIGWVALTKQMNKEWEREFTLSWTGFGHRVGDIPSQT